MHMFFIKLFDIFFLIEIISYFSTHPHTDRNNFRISMEMSHRLTSQFLILSSKFLNEHKYKHSHTHTRTHTHTHTQTHKQIHEITNEKT